MVVRCELSRLASADLLRSATEAASAPEGQLPLLPLGDPRHQLASPAHRQSQENAHLLSKSMHVVLPACLRSQSFLNAGCMQAAARSRGSCMPADVQAWHLHRWLSHSSRTLVATGPRGASGSRAPSRPRCSAVPPSQAPALGGPQGRQAGARLSGQWCLCGHRCCRCCLAQRRASAARRARSPAAPAQPEQAQQDRAHAEARNATKHNLAFQTFS